MIKEVFEIVDRNERYTFTIRKTYGRIIKFSLPGVTVENPKMIEVSIHHLNGADIVVHIYDGTQLEYILIFRTIGKTLFIFTDKPETIWLIKNIRTYRNVISDVFDPKRYFNWRE